MAIDWIIKNIIIRLIDNILMSTNANGQIEYDDFFAAILFYFVIDTSAD